MDDDHPIVSLLSSDKQWCHPLPLAFSLSQRGEALVKPGSSHTVERDQPLPESRKGAGKDRAVTVMVQTQTNERENMAL
jgi:hypothetical protein